MLYAGLDISLTCTGLVILDIQGAVVSRQLIESKPEKGANPIKRLLGIRDRIHNELGAAESRLSEDVVSVCIEGYAFSKNAGMMFDRAELVGLVKAKLYLDATPMHIVGPMVLKKFTTGKGNAEKSLMLQQILKRWGFEARDDNEGDAYALAQVGRALAGYTGTKEQLAALAKLAA